MAVPAYTTDLFTLDPADTTTGWTEPTTPETGGGLPQNGTEFFIEGSACVSKACAGAGGITGGALYNEGAGVTVTANDAVYTWLFFAAPNTLLARASGGFSVCIGSGLGAYRKWYVLGNDNYQYGGWQCIAVDPAVAGSLDIGTPSGTLQYFGAVVKTSATISKGEPFGIDAVRHGRTLQIVDGSQADGFGLFTGAATANDHPTTGRWGIFQAIDGGYQLQGRFLLGTAGTAVDFRDSNTSVLIANTLYVTAGFNVIEVRNTASRVDLTAVSFLALGTVSRGNFLVTDNADVNIDACSFTSMGTFALLGATAITNSTLRSCDTITASGSDLRGTSVLTSRVAANASAVIWNVNTNPNGLLDNMTFSKGTNAHHAIEFGTSSPLTMTLTGIDFTGFSALQNNDASIFHIKRTSGAEEVTINLIGCTSDVSFATSYRTDGATVRIVQNPVTFKVTAKDLDTGAVIENARVMVPVTNGDNFPYQVVVTITSAGTTAIVAHATHGLATNDNILIAGAIEDDYNGAFTITKIDANSYSYTMIGDPASPATTATNITATMVLLNGFTNASGVITDTRTYSANQTVSGWVRRHTYGPSYTSATWTESTSTLTKTGAFTGMSGAFLITITAGTNMTPGVYLATWVNANSVTLPGGAGSADSSNVEFTIGAKPLYRQAPVVDLIPSSAGKEVTVFLQPDE